jgi:hypothetical protein
LPEQIISASGCIATFIPDTWCIEWTQDTSKNRSEEAKTFGLDDSRVLDMIKWVTPKFNDTIVWPNIVIDITVAVRLVGTFLSNLPDVRLLEIALHKSQTDEFCLVAEPPPQQPGFAPNGRQGVHEAILKTKSPSKDGHVLGFEPLVFDYSLSCSWLCNRLDTVVAEHLNIRPNQHGFVETFAEACQCVEYISKNDVGAEPGLWLPWLLLDHSEKVRQRKPVYK